MSEEPKQAEKHLDGPLVEGLQEQLLTRILSCTDEDLVVVAWKRRNFCVSEEPKQAEKHLDGPLVEGLQKQLLTRILPCTDEVLMAIIYATPIS